MSASLSLVKMCLEGVWFCRQCEHSLPVLHGEQDGQTCDRCFMPMKKEGGFSKPTDFARAEFVHAERQRMRANAFAPAPGAKQALKKSKKAAKEQARDIKLANAV